MFKNLLIYRLAETWQPDLDALVEAADAATFIPCGATQPISAGWVAPRGRAHGSLVESIGGHWLLRLMVEQKVLPGSVVKRRIDEMAERIEADTGRKPGKKQRKDMKDQAQLELLPQAFTKQLGLPVWIAPQEGLLMIDAASTARADEVITLLTKGLAGFSIEPIHTALAPATAMAGWLLAGATRPGEGEMPEAAIEPPAVFTIDRDCELKAPDVSKSVVRYARHPLDTEEVRSHIEQGKRPTRLALTWNGRVSFVLTEQMVLKKIEFLDGVQENTPSAGRDGDDGFDADAAIATGELIRLIPDLLDALGGEQKPGLFEASATATPTTMPMTTPAAPAKTSVSADAPPWE
ncbi:recombination-associated protein RdgC [Sphaerotilus mobilis]|uniref:Recombination-associated protein RdgC n=1 Tax=Sphaerotilus mobilis TaxID=47994 RepID=A0A4Q7LUF6_9BURK|nr:recombination-associated protein RdgC [Sphaerotilus mobilis]RZS58454.1 recombination associated protein RdgC [Sphaerotilus mobilis]